MATATWLHATSGNFATSSNWSPGTPGSGDDAVINLVGGYTVSLTTAQSVNSLLFDAPGAALAESSAGALLMGGALTVDSGTVTLNGANTIGSGVSLNGGELAVGNGSALGGGALTIDGGTLVGTANVSLPNQLVMSGAFTIGAATGTTLNLNSSA